jgi:glyoxylase-like metal-dependent hydrolase (beta-lactamase superfamily II)
MIITRYPVGPLETNCYHLVCEDSGESVLIDPGGIPHELFRPDRTLTLKAILLTHGHFDHIGAVREVAGRTGAPVAIHRLDALMLEDPFLNGSSFFGPKTDPIRPDMLLDGGERIEFGGCALTVLPTPGHTMGSVSFLSEAESAVFAGDVLFRLSVGRWDLPGGDYQTLVRTIREVFSPMPDEMKVYPGHGELTTIGFERMYNEFMADV